MSSSKSADFLTCHAQFDGQRLILANRHIQRTWKLIEGQLYAESLKDVAAGREWISSLSRIPSLVLSGGINGNPIVVEFTTRDGVDRIGEAESLVAEIAVGDASDRHIYRFKIFPDSPAVTMKLITVGVSASISPSSIASTPSPASPIADGIELAPGTGASHSAPVADAIDCFPINPLHLSVTQITLTDRTDVHDNLVFEQQWFLQPAEPLVRLRGNVLFLEDRLTGDGLIFFKQAPLPHARPVKCDADLDIRESMCQFLGHGLPTDGGEGYAAAVISYRGGRIGRIAALHTYQRQFGTYNPKRDGLLLSSTWGDRSKDGRIGEEFIIAEIAAASRLGVDVFTIDDGWQRGTSSNSAAAGGIWTGFWALDPDYWIPSPCRFPNGLKPIVAAAKKHGVKLGLWYVPDSSDDFANWQRDAAQILKLHRAYNVDHFKIDGVKMYTLLGQTNLGRLYDAVLNESNGRIALDQDVTAAVRPGYFGQMRAGPVFVENRYTDWHRYWPHCTLRNFWMLSQYIDPLRLRMEFLNHTRNAHLYVNDPLAPAKYRADYLFASVMFASPLGWFEVSNLSADYIEQAAPLIQLWKQHRERIHRGRIIPIGSAPDGLSWTGFAADHDGRRGHLLIFRELNGQEMCEIDVPMFPQHNYHVKKLAGDGSAEVCDGKALIRIPDVMRFLWVEIEAT